MPMAAAPWVVSDELWELVEPILPKRTRLFRYPGRCRHAIPVCNTNKIPHSASLSGSRRLPLELGFGSGTTCWRRLDEWQKAGVWERLHELLLTRVANRRRDRVVVGGRRFEPRAGQKGALRRARAQSIAEDQAPSATSSLTRGASLSPLP
jgi:transposase